MLKFQFSLQNQILHLTHSDHSLILDKNHHFHTLGGIGFALDYPESPHQPSRWIIFRVYSRKVKVVYKTISSDGSAVYLRQVLPYPRRGVVKVEF